LPSIVFVVAKPIVGMPKKLITLGDHIKKKRLEENLFQKDIGKVIGTDNFTIVNWEKNSTKNIPAKYYPKIMEFLTYCPFEKPPLHIRPNRQIQKQNIRTATR
jgi:DNA-binding XRE family transcriptional regulator